MKKNWFTLLLIFTTFNICFAQLNRTGSFIENSAVYPISGDVTVTYNAGIISVQFENNFSTVQGITLEVFLGKSNNLNTATDLKISTAPLDSGTPMSTPITGSRTFTASSGTNLYEFDNVLVYCTSANVLWGYVNLCENSLNLTTGPLPSDTYRGEQIILSSSLIDNNATVSFETKDTIVLNENFEVPNSSNFNAAVDATHGCLIE